MKYFSFLTLVLIGWFIAVTSNGLLAQAIPFIYKKAKILECKPPYQTVTMDLLDSDEEQYYSMVFPLEGVQIHDRKGSSIPIESLRPGAEVSIEGEEINYRKQLKKITVLAKWVGDEVEVDGLIEHYDSETGVAMIDGQKVKLAFGVPIKGQKDKKCRDHCGDCDNKRLPTVTSFSGLNLGRFVSAKGKRQGDGIILAEAVEYCPNALSKIDRELLTILGEELSDEAVEKVGAAQYRGNIQIGDASFKLVENLRVQGYVGYLANRLIPDYLKNIPPEAPAHINFRVYVIENPTFNAFALPNGIIVVHDGLLAMLENEAQLAAILGHEIAHVTHEHSASRYKTNKDMQVGATILKIGTGLINKLDTDDTDGIAVAFQKISQAANALPPQTQQALLSVLYSNGNLSNVYSGAKGQESQSDRVGLFYMQQAGYDPREAANVWRRFMELTGKDDFMSQLQSSTQQWITTADMFPYQNPLASAGDFILATATNIMLDNWFSSHPKARKRYRSLNQLVAINYADMDFSDTMTGKEEFEEVQGLLEK